MSANSDQNRLPLPADPPAYVDDEEAGDIAPLPQYERHEARPPRYTLPLGPIPRGNTATESHEGAVDRIQRSFGQFIQRLRQSGPRQPHDDDDELERRIATLEGFLRAERADRIEELRNDPPAFENPATVRRRAAEAARRREREEILKRIEEIKRDAALQKEMNELLEKVTDVFRQFKNYFKPRDRDDEGSAGGAVSGTSPDFSAYSAAYFGY